MEILSHGHERTFRQNPGKFIISGAQLYLHKLHWADTCGHIALRRGNSFAHAGAMDLLNDFDIWEYPLRLILRKSGNGTFEFPTPYVDISAISSLANDTFGLLTGDCSLSRADEQFNVGHFTTARKADCMGVAGSLGDETRCYENDRRCRQDSCEEQCCASAQYEYDRNSTCMWVQVSPRGGLSADVTFMDLLEHLSKWSLDAPLGTGFEFQKISILMKAKPTDLNRDVESETIKQLHRTSEAVEALLTQMVVDAENGIPRRPSSVELALVCATILSAILAVDSSRLYKGLSRLLVKSRVKIWWPLWKKLFLLPLVFAISILPAVVPVAIIIYQEVCVSQLDMRRFGNGWHGNLIRDSPTGEDLFWIRRVMTEVHFTSEHKVRVAYILVPLFLLGADVFLEGLWLLRFLFGADQLSEAAAVKGDDGSEIA
ncbi:hypothetical protein FGB62_200g06 [Gracilaria domingensis]|nr:hypothetical protein FGB62_200g06 [Gracilaria domingensis]